MASLPWRTELPDEVVAALVRDLRMGQARMEKVKEALKVLGYNPDEALASDNVVEMPHIEEPSPSVSKHIPIIEAGGLREYPSVVDAVDFLLRKNEEKPLSLAELEVNFKHGQHRSYKPERRMWDVKRALTQSRHAFRIFSADDPDLKTLRPPIDEARGKTRYYKPLLDEEVFVVRRKKPAK